MKPETPPHRPDPPTPLLPSPPREGRTEAPEGTPQFPSPLGGGRTRRTPRAPLFPNLRIAATLRIAGRATRGMPRAPDPGAKTNLRGAAHAARWGGGEDVGRACAPSNGGPSNPPALGLSGSLSYHRGRPGSRRRPPPPPPPACLRPAQQKISIIAGGAKAAASP